MSRKHTESCRAISESCYPQTLKEAISRHLPCSLFKAEKAAHGLRWCERYLALCILMMAWSSTDTLGDRFDQARRGLAAMFPGRTQPGKTYQGFLAALAQRSESLLEKISDHLRGEVRRMAGEHHWEHRGFVPIGADGSKVECSRTEANEKQFGCASKKKGAPQQFVTTLLHLPTGVVWQFVTGPARSSERHHLREMLCKLPANALLIADAGFTGYDLLAAIMGGGHSFLIRVGANVRLLLKLGYALQERDGIVYLWPDEARKNMQPPLVLRLITLTDGRNRRMHLLSNLLEDAQLSEAAACDFYTMRWGIELHYRALKQTLARRKLASDAPHNAQMELRWAMVGLWLLCLMALSAIAGCSGDVRRLSVAAALRRVRRAMDAPARRSGSAGLGRQLAGALRDGYVRTAPKRARNWAHKKKPKPIGDPKARIAESSEVKQAIELRNQKAAA
jgi:Transposase DDE domain